LTKNGRESTQQEHFNIFVPLTRNFFLLSQNDDIKMQIQQLNDKWNKNLINDNDYYDEMRKLLQQQQEASSK
jgi:hypothetical protein